MEEKFKHGKDSKAFKAKKKIDKLLPVAFLSVIAYLFLEFFTDKTNSFYIMKPVLQYSILAYFIAEITIDFIIYEENKEFFKDKWLDIILTMPFLTAFKGLKSLKLIKSAKLGKLLKTGKIVQKTGKLVTKGKKLVKKI